jgi:hypothetical protein
LSGQPSDLEQQVRSRFSVKQFFALPDGELEFQVAYDGDTKRRFAELSATVASMGYVPSLQGSKNECVLLLRKVDATPRRASRLPVLFALFTSITLVVFALLQQQVYQQLVPTLSAYAVFFEFGVTIAVIFAAHEAVQRYVGRRRDAGHASSYLIPSIPFLPPFLPSLGFVSSQHEPALNRDRLFDTVIAGPLAMLVLAVILYAVGDLTATQSAALAPGSQLANSTVSINSNAIQMGIDWVLRPLVSTVASGNVLVSPIADGATVGFILVFIGLLPMAFYDGGFLSSLVLSEGPARIASYLSVLALLLLDTPTYWALAVVVLLLAGRPFQIRLRDEVSGLSTTRKWIFVGSIALAFLCLPFPHNLGTLPLS